VLLGVSTQPGQVQSAFSQLGKPGDRNAKLSANLRSNDHAFIIAGAEITKAARNWLGNKLDASKRSQLLFMDRDDILNLFVVTNLPLPAAAFSETKPFEDENPF
jgi:hypothetical protein